MNEEGWGLQKEERLVWFSIDWLCADLAANEGFSLFNFEINGCIDLQLSQLMEQQPKRLFKPRCYCVALGKSKEECT